MPGELIIEPHVNLDPVGGGQGFFLGDGDAFITVKGDRSAKAPPPWQPLLVHAQWLADEWGTSWLKAEQIDRI